MNEIQEVCHIVGCEDVAHDELCARCERPTCFNHLRLDDICRPCQAFIELGL